MDTKGKADEGVLSTWLACGTSEIADKYRQAKWNVAQVVAKVKTQVWKALGEAK